MENFESGEFQPPEEYEISTGDEQRVTYPDKVLTGGIATCHAIGILNVKKGLGYLGHYVNGETSAEQLLAQAMSDADGSLDDLVVALTGNASLPSAVVTANGDNYQQYLEATHAHGQWLVDLLQTNGIKNVQNRLINGPSRNSYAMVVDTKSGKITITKEY